MTRKDIEEHAALSTDAAAELVELIKPAFAGVPPEIAGAALGELLAIFVAGHHPGMRDEAFKMVINLARDLVSPTIEEMIAVGRAPPAWRGVTKQ
jgi:hypothetical protein